MIATETGPLFVLALGALFAPLFSRRIGIPTAVGEILLGIVVGIFLGPQSGGLLEALAFLGFALLMFTAGAEIDFAEIERGSGRQFVVALAFIAVCLGVATLLARGLGYPVVIGLASGVISIGVAVAALRETGLIQEKIGQTVLVVGGIGEGISLVALTALDLGRQTAGSGLGIALVKLGGALVATYVFLIVVRGLVWWYPEQFAGLVEARDPSEVGVRAAFAVMLAFVAAAVWIGIEPILGAFLSGAIFAFVFRSKEALQGKLTSIGYGFLIPFFFIGVGQDLRLDALTNVDTLRATLVFLVLTLLPRILAAPLLRASGLGPAPALATALFLSAPLTLQVATARLGADLHLLDPSDVTALVLVATLLGVLAPTAARRLVRPRTAPVRPFLISTTPDP